MKPKCLNSQLDESDLRPNYAKAKIIIGGAKIAFREEMKCKDRSAKHATHMVGLDGISQALRQRKLEIILLRVLRGDVSLWHVPRT